MVTTPKLTSEVTLIDIYPPSDDVRRISGYVSLIELQRVFQRALNTYPDPSPQLLELADKIAAL